MKTASIPQPITARIITYLFHPLLLPTWLFSALFWTAEGLFLFGSQVKWLMLLLVTLFTGVFPAISVLFLLTTSFIPNLQFAHRSERLIPLTSTTVYYSMLAYLFLEKFAISDLLAALATAGALTAAVLTFTTALYRISLTAAALGALNGCLWAIQLTHPSDNLLYPILFFVWWPVVSFPPASNSSRPSPNRPSPDSLSGSSSAWLRCFTFFSQCGLKLWPDILGTTS